MNIFGTALSPGLDISVKISEFTLFMRPFENEVRVNSLHVFFGNLLILLVLAYTSAICKRV